MDVQRRTLIEFEALIGTMRDNIDGIHQDLGTFYEWKWKMEKSEGRMLVKGSPERPIRVPSEGPEDEYRVCHEQS